MFYKAARKIINYELRPGMQFELNEGSEVLEPALKEYRQSKPSKNTQSGDFLQADSAAKGQTMKQQNQISP